MKHQNIKTSRGPVGKYKLETCHWHHDYEQKTTRMLTRHYPAQHPKETFPLSRHTILRPADVAYIVPITFWGTAIPRKFAAPSRLGTGVDCAFCRLHHDLMLLRPLKGSLLLDWTLVIPKPLCCRLNLGASR